MLSATHVFNALSAWKEALRDLALAFLLFEVCRSKTDFWAPQTDGGSSCCSRFWRRSGIGGGCGGGPRGAGGGYLQAVRSFAHSATGVESQAGVAHQRGLCAGHVRPDISGGEGGRCCSSTREEVEIGPCWSREGAVLSTWTSNTPGVSHSGSLRVLRSNRLRTKPASREAAATMSTVVLVPLCLSQWWLHWHRTVSFSWAVELARLRWHATARFISLGGKGDCYAPNSFDWSVQRLFFFCYGNLRPYPFECATYSTIGQGEVFNRLVVIEGTLARLLSQATKYEGFANFVIMPNCQTARGQEAETSNVRFWRFVIHVIDVVCKI